MKGTDHERIATAVVSVGLWSISESELEQLKYGSTLPDSIDKRAHHHGREQDVVVHIHTARDYFLTGSLGISAQEFGMALHYIADATCPGTDARSNHQDWEREVSSLPIPRVKPAKINTPTQIESTILSLAKPRSPRSSIWTSIHLGAGLLELIWRPPNEKNPDEDQLIKEARKMVPNSWLRRFSAYLVLATIAYNIWLAILFDIGWLLIAIPFVATGTGITYYRLDKRERKYRWILDWYGLKR